MEFNVNSPVLFVMVAILIALVLAQSVYFLIRALKRAKAIGIDKSVIKKTISSAAVFTIAPAVAILVGVLTLSKSLGIAIPWLRLSIIGSLSYETIAASTALEALGLSSGDTITDANAFVTVLWVMTIGIIIGLVLVPFLTKKIQNGIKKIEKRDKKWSDIFSNAMFLGMISAFLGYVFCDVTNVFKGDMSGLIPVCVMAVSAVIMAICGLLAIKLKVRWLTDYALPISLVVGMASAIPITSLLG
ncbi:MAG: DUF5058 family protein [Clostridia bacterium]|nr:DUF5058 family protein [Clostridia bacterium]